MRSGYDRGLVRGLMIWALKTCPLAGGSVILLCLVMHALGVNTGWLGCKGGQFGAAAALGVPLSDGCI